MMTASTGPVVTGAVRMRARVSGGPNPPGQRRENHGNEHGRDDDFQHAPQALLRFDTRGKRAIHAAVMTKGRAVLGQQFQ